MGEQIEQADWWRLARFVPSDERLVLRMKPSRLSIGLLALWMIVLGLLVGLGLVLNGRLGAWANPAGWAVLLVVVMRIVWESLAWSARLYVLTDRRVVRVTGVFRQHVADIPIEKIQNVAIHRLLRERLFGLGTIGFASAGTDGYEAVWLMVRDPIGTAEAIRRTMKGTPGPPRDKPVRKGRGAGVPVVIGLAGGIGSGKSAAAEEFAALGCVVSDSDKLAREALDRPEVRDELVSWWGEEILNAEGRVDRKAVAEIVFKDTSRRERLERLVHPIVRASRDELIKTARSVGAPAVIVDAPLLFEAGLDADCDAVVFVDASIEIRLARVVRSRGWDADELARRESAQWSIEQKCDRSDHVVENAGDRGDLRAAVSAILERILNGSGSRGTPEPK